MAQTPAPAQAGAAVNWRAVEFVVRYWGDEAVLLDDATGAIHLIPADTGRLLQQLASGAPAAPSMDDSAVHLHELDERLSALERIGLIRRDTPTA